MTVSTSGNQPPARGDAATLLDTFPVIKYWYVNVYSVGDAYGGPEEGGWWYSVGEFLESKGQFSTKPAAEEYKAQVEANVEQTGTYNMGNGPHDGVGPDGEPDDAYLTRGGTWGEEKIKVLVQSYPGRNFPQERPFYE